MLLLSTVFAYVSPHFLLVFVSCCCVSCCVLVRWLVRPLVRTEKQWLKQYTAKAKAQAMIFSSKTNATSYQQHRLGNSRQQELPEAGSTHLSLLLLSHQRRYFVSLFGQRRALCQRLARRLSAKRCNKHATAIAQFESAKLCKALQYTAIKSHADEACQLLRVEGIHWQLTGRTISEIKLSALIVCQRWYLSTVLLLDGVDGVARVCIQL